MHWIFIASLYFLRTRFSYAELCERVVALGLESRDISDKQISASSSFNQHLLPQFARLNQTLLGGAWCPETSPHEKLEEYIEIQLQSIHVITDILTQGRSGHLKSLEVTPSYVIAYSRDLEGNDWRRWRNRAQDQVLEGNALGSSSDEIVRNTLDPAIIARRIRIYPYLRSAHVACLRLELFGCQYTDLIDYKVPDGVRVGNELYRDVMYDGSRSEDYLAGGVGLLTDGHLEAPNATGITPGYWLGWKNTARTVPMVFDFDKTRFKGVGLYCAQDSSRQIEPPSSVRVWFTSNTHVYERNSIVHPNTVKSHGWLYVPLNDREATKVRLELSFDAKYIFISEIRFITDENDTWPVIMPDVPDVAMSRISAVSVAYQLTDEQTTPSPRPRTNGSSDWLSDGQLIGIIIGVSVTFVLVIIVIIVLCIRAIRHTKSHNQLSDGTVPLQTIVNTDCCIHQADSDTDSKLLSGNGINTSPRKPASDCACSRGEQLKHDHFLPRSADDDLHYASSALVYAPPIDRHLGAQKQPVNSDFVYQPAYTDRYDRSRPCDNLLGHVDSNDIGHYADDYHYQHHYGQQQLYNNELVQTPQPTCSRVLEPQSNHEYHQVHNTH